MQLEGTPPLRTTLSGELSMNSTINPDLRKELLYSREYGFIEDKPQDDELKTPNLLRKDDNRKSGKALTRLLKGKVQSETPHMVKTTAGAVYRKSDIAQAKKRSKKSRKKGNISRNPHGVEPKTKTKKKESVKEKLTSDPDEMPETQARSEMANVETLY